LKKDILFNCLDISFKLLHPFMPFLTEELWQHIHRVSDKSILEENYPDSQDWNKWIDSEADSKMQILQDIVHATRSIRSSFSINTPAEIIISLESNTITPQFLLEYKEELAYFCKAPTLLVQINSPIIKGAAYIVANNACKVYLPLKKKL